MNRLFLIALTSLIFNIAYAGEPLLFGPEFTFAVPVDKHGKQLVQNGDALIEMGEHMKLILFEQRSEDEQFEVTYVNEFKSPNGWSLRIKPDNGVVEAVMRPMTVENYERYASEIQEALFDTAYLKGFPPAYYTGGGHISISAAYFIDKPLLYRNFIVDLLNHSELALGVWSFDTNNALSPALYPPKVWTRIREILKEFDESAEEDIIKLKIFNTEMQSLFIHIKDPYFYFWHKSIASRNKFSFINLTHVSSFDREHSRLELRAFRPQVNMDMFVRQIRLLKKRILYLEKLTEPLELKPNFKKPSPDDIASPATADEALTPPINPQWAIGEYYKYVTESGEKWADHYDYLWPQWKFSGEVKRFNEYLESCNGLFEPTP